ncbi:STAS domain-containing protein [Micromonospora sp. DT44]|uniref:STAS domain-containing protein n=1 Tax=Micromonospora sp. DT44 TaxID=3393439 RepID=UPI003CF74FAC
MDLTITAVRSGPRACLHLYGRLGAATAGLVHDEVLAALRIQAVGHVDLDLTGLARFDPAATSTLVACHRAVHVRGGDLRLVNISPQVRRQHFAAGLLGLLAASDAAAAVPPPAPDVSSPSPLPQQVQPDPRTDHAGS